MLLSEADMAESNRVLMVSSPTSDESAPAFEEREPEDMGLGWDQTDDFEAAQDDADNRNGWDGDDPGGDE